eukprot:8838389-Pyramimonas_sp.AAC.1
MSGFHLFIRRRCKRLTQRTTFSGSPATSLPLALWAVNFWWLLKCTVNCTNAFSCEGGGTNRTQEAR